MKAVIQRVKYATVKVDNKIIGECKQGFMILLGTYMYKHPEIRRKKQ